MRRYPGRHGVRTMTAPVTRGGGGPLVVLLSGPNLDLLGERQPEVYGAPRSPITSPRPPRKRPRCGLELEHHQTNHEGELVELVHGARGRAAALIVNAGALSHYSWSLHDALAAFDGDRGRAAPLQPRGARAVAPHLGGRRGGGRRRRRLRRASATPRPSRPWPGSSPPHRRDPDDRARRPVHRRRLGGARVTGGGRGLHCGPGGGVGVALPPLQVADGSSGCGPASTAPGWTPSSSPRSPTSAT